MPELLSASQKKSLSTVLGKCNQCRPYIEMLKQLGEDTREIEDRVKHMSESASGALELNELMGRDAVS